MAGYSRIYVVGEEGGFQGADGVNPISYLILVGDSSRQWRQAHYVDTSIKPIGKLNVIIPAAPEEPDALLDAVIAFSPAVFESCPSLPIVQEKLQGVERLDFDISPDEVPAEWQTLREEARETFRTLHIWQADLQALHLI